MFQKPYYPLPLRTIIPPPPPSRHDATNSRHKCFAFAFVPFTCIYTLNSPILLNVSTLIFLFYHPIFDISLPPYNTSARFRHISQHIIPILFIPGSFPAWGRSWLLSATYRPSCTWGECAALSSLQTYRKKHITWDGVDHCSASDCDLLPLCESL
jgi:hypothetical protein